MNELTGALAAGFWMLGRLGLFTAWRATGDALQGNVARSGGRRRRKGTPGYRVLLHVPRAVPTTPTIRKKNLFH